MIKFEFEATINSNLEQAFTNLDIENIDVLDEDQFNVAIENNFDLTKALTILE